MNTIVTVTLTKGEMWRAAAVGITRHIQTIEGKHRSPLLGANAWNNDIDGALGECAFAKGANLYWGGTVGTFKKFGDVDGLEVRTRRSPHYELFVRPDDADDRSYVLVRGNAPTYDLVGWMRGGEAKRPEWLAEHGGGAPAYFVKDRFLRPLTELLLQLAEQKVAALQLQLEEQQSNDGRCVKQQKGTADHEYHH